MNKNSVLMRKVYLASLLPNVIAVLGGTVNVFFDGILVGQKLGETGLTSVSQSLPIYLILCTIGSLFASGSCFLSSIAFGANDRKEGQRIFRAGLCTSTLAGLLFCALGLLFSPQITRLIASAETYESVLTYVRVTLLGGVFKVILYFPFFYLRLEGKNRRSACAMLTMTVLNIALDALFLFVFDLGIAGAAWASVIATAVACAMTFLFLFTDRSDFLPGFSLFTKRDWAQVLRYGSPMALNNVLSSLRILLLNLLLRSTGQSGLLAVFAVMNNVGEFSICIRNGVPQTAGAMTGIFFGEKDSDSVKRLLNLQLITGLCAASGFSLLLCAFSGSVGRLFGSDSDCTAAAICFACSLLPAVICSILSYYYNAVDRVGMANVITVCEGFLMPVLFCFLCRPLGGMIWLFFPFAEAASLLAVLLAGEAEARKRPVTRFYLLDESFERSGRCISFSTDCSNEKICEASERIRDFCEENGFPSKKTMAISLAIEEILTIIASKSLKGVGTMDVRILRSGDEAIVRVRSGGERYNPIEAQNEDDLDYLGVRMITKMASKTEYYSTLGINSLLIFLS